MSLAITTLSRSHGWAIARVLAALLLVAAIPAFADPAVPQLLDALAGSLTDRIEAAPAKPDLPPGLVIDVERRRLPALNAVLFETSLTNKSAQAVTVGRVPVLDLAFRLQDRAEDAPFKQLTYRNDEWYGSTYWTGPDWTRVGNNWHHPGQDTPSVRCFHVPRDGRVTISGAARKLHLDGDGVRLAILHGDQEVWNAEIDGKDGEGVDPSLTLFVQRGDRLRFIVSKRGEIFCDTTGWDPAITYEDGESHQASKGFSTSRQGEGGWFYELQATAATGPYPKLTYKNEEWYGSTFWTGPDWTRVGKDWHHPGEDTPSVRCLRLPRKGRVTITGRVFKLHKAGDGITARIAHGRRDVWSAEIEGEDGTGVEPNVALDVQAGDTLRFIVGKRGGISCDTTGWDPVVTYEDGTRLQASQGFSTSAQGDDGWFYEMLVVQQSPPPTLHTLGADLAYSRALLAEGGGTSVSEKDALPLAVLADGADVSGAVLAANATDAWSLNTRWTEDGLLRVTLSAGGEGQPISLAPGERYALPPALYAAYEGPWIGSLDVIRAIANRGGDLPALGALGERLAGAYASATAGLEHAPDLDLLLMAQGEWWDEDRVTGSAKSLADAVTDHLARADDLIQALSDGGDAAFLERASAQLRGLRRDAETPDRTQADWLSLYMRTRLLKRAIAFSNPLLDFDKLLLCKRVPPWYSHLVMQYYGWRARPGGGLFILDRPGYSLGCRDILDGRLVSGSVLEPRLSWDASRIVFSYVQCPETPLRPDDLVVNEDGPDVGYYHVYEVNVDGTGLRQLTSGPYDDMMPAYLPDGGIAFCSTRRQGYSRCFGAQFSRRWDSYTVHRMDADGSGMRRLSANDVSEWFPTVSNSGHIIYARWDYIDRDAVTHQNLWAMRPDGTNPVAVWGNASPRPHCMFQAKPIPNSNKIVFTAAAHHTITGGPVCLLTPGIDPNDMSAVERVTPRPFPEAEGWSAPDYYDSPWPLSEDYFLVAYSPTPLIAEGKGPNKPNALGIYLLDRAGNRELVYRDAQIGGANATPLVPRPAPPIVSGNLPAEAPATGEMTLLDVYQGLGDVPRGSIKQLRIIQIFPKTTPIANNPPIGLAGEENARAILGTVPVEEDGSARFEAPAGKPFLFQALDGDGFAYQTMRSLTYLQPGEKLSCVGCHENQMSAPPNGRTLAASRPPSRIDPGELGGEPFCFTRVVQPVLDKHCISCHSGPEAPKGIDLTSEPRAGFTRSYWSLCGEQADFAGTNTNAKRAAEALVPRFGARNQVQMTPPGGIYGARGSRLVQMLREGHQKVSLSPGDLRRIGAWIDCNAVFYGSYEPERQARELAGEATGMPEVQ